MKQATLEQLADRYWTPEWIERPQMKQPTPKQLEAYYWTHIVGLNNIDAGVRMGITGQGVGKLLKKIYKIRPLLRPNPKLIPRPSNTVSTVDVGDCDINHNF